MTKHTIGVYKAYKNSGNLRFPKPPSLEDGMKSDINACGVTVSVWGRKNESKIKS
jgi:hypothetical protein